MSRGVDSAILTELANNNARVCHLFKASFLNRNHTTTDSEGNTALTDVVETYYFTDNSFNVTFADEEYSFLGQLLSIDGIEEYSDSRIASVTVTIAGVPARVGDVLSYSFIDQPMTIFRAFVNDDLNDQAAEGEGVENSAYLIGDAIKVFEGTMEQPQIKESFDNGTIIVSVRATSVFSDFAKTSGRHSNHEEQQAFFNGDRIFEMVGNMEENVMWGQK